MVSDFAQQLDGLAAWRRSVESHVGGFARFLQEHGLDEAGHGQAALQALSQRVASDRLNVAFVAEFSRGKSELINAMFFADTGQRVLPATPGRTTMCPVELGFVASEAPQLSLLPIETRLEDMPLSEWRLPAHAQRWKRIRLDPQDTASLVTSLQEVMRTKSVTLDRARDLSLWHDDRPDDNPPMAADGLVEVPAWRHAIINYPHPLLRRGLVVLDTPGLNAIGTEPELTLSLLPSAHACVFILGADTGVTKSDLTVWRDHLSNPAMTRLVVLNKIDTLADPLLSKQVVQAQIESQRQATALQLGVPPKDVYPVSARQALAGVVEARKEVFDASRIAALESALSEELLPGRVRDLGGALIKVAEDVEQRVSRLVQERRRLMAEQTLELRSLRGKSAGKTSLLVKRVQQEAEEFERGATKATAVRSIHVRMLRAQLQALASDNLRGDFDILRQAMDGSFLNLGGKRAFATLFERVRARLSDAKRHGIEAQAMLEASFKQLNADYGFALNVPPTPSLDACGVELDMLENNYGQYLTPSNVLRMKDKRFQEQFRRMLMAKMRLTMELASTEVEQWHKLASHQLDSQLRQRREAYKQRQDTLQRVVGAQDELEGRIQEIEDQDRAAVVQLQRAQSALVAMRQLATKLPEAVAATDAVPAASSAKARKPADDGDNGFGTTRPSRFEVRPHTPTGFHVDSHSAAVRVDTSEETQPG
jgi:hypothetical protein